MTTIKLQKSYSEHGSEKMLYDTADTSDVAVKIVVFKK